MATEPPRLDARSIAMLLALSVLWGGSFYFAGVAVRELPPLTMDGFEVYLELFALAHRRGFRISEVPVRFVHQTESGEVSVWRQGPRQLANTLRVWRLLQTRA